MTRFVKHEKGTIAVAASGVEVEIAARSGTSTWPGDGTSTVTQLSRFDSIKFTITNNSTASVGFLNIGTGDVTTGANFKSWLPAGVTVVGGESYTGYASFPGGAAQSVFVTEAAIDATCDWDVKYIEKRLSTTIA